VTKYVSTRIRNTTADVIAGFDHGFGAESFPNWARWVREGTNSSTDVTGNIDSGGAMIAEVGGEFYEDPIAVIDLSSALSHALGRQLTQNQTYRISYLGVTLENDDSGTNNNSGGHFSGQWLWYSPQSHRVTAYRTYRDAHKLHYGGGSASDSDLFALDGTGGDYKALRLGLCSTGQGISDTQVPFISDDPFSDVVGTKPTLQEIFEAYDDANGAIGIDYDNRMWRDGRTGYPDSMAWSASLMNCDNGLPYTATNDSSDLICDAEAMCGLLALRVTGTNAIRDLVINDEFHFRVTIGIDGWGGDF
jgi:hypothetical protein